MPTINDTSLEEGTKTSGRRTVPQPNDVRGAAEFIAMMRRLQRWSGLSLQELEARTAQAPVLMPGGLAGILGGSTLPRREVVSAFVSACGCVPEVQAEWMRAYARVSSPSPRPSAVAPAKLVASAKPVAAPEPPVPPPPEKRQAEEQPKRRPRHRKSSGRRDRSARRSLSPLVAAPAFITVAVVAIAMVTALGDDSGKHENKESGKPSLASPPGNGWYSIQPEASVSVGNCLTILPDDQFAPTLSLEECDEEDDLQRFWLETHTANTHVVQGHTVDGRLWCLTLDAPGEGSRLHLTACDEANKWQRFNLEATRPQGETAAGKGTSQPTPLFNLRSPETRQNGMCVGIDSARKGSIQAMHTTCTKTGIWGYSFVQTTPPAGT
ncbi:ricin-type beta-trefoil lectin domain protein [Actinomadura welshii]|uniref:ricin-type beta-trefoil lectin domain protein n=1 Tax=Actinomadura welshii TaxID=3103817 RepID=UPI001378282C|nr:ricin-type beta-trefoil lectin domain protein [Actinomadura madurae]